MQVLLIGEINSRLIVLTNWTFHCGGEVSGESGEMPLDSR